MARRPRVEFENAVYHVMCRGDHKEPVFLNDGDRKMFLRTLWQGCNRTGWRVHAYVLMENHYHALIETPEANLVAGMRWLQSTYTMRFNRRNNKVGHLFQGRYKALLVDPENDGYFLQVSTYIHLNPLRAGLLDLEHGGMDAYEWSSYPWYRYSQKRRPKHLCIERVLGGLYLKDTAKGRRGYRSYIERCLHQIVGKDGRDQFESEWEPIRCGWCLGDEKFRTRMGTLLDGVLSSNLRTSYSGTGVKSHDEQTALGLLDAGLKALGLKHDDLVEMRKSDVRKRALAWWIKSQTVVTNRWLGERLYMGHETNVSKAVAVVWRGEGEETEECRRKLETITPRIKD